jgi:zinc protease
VDDRFYGLADPGYLAGIRPNLDRMTLEEVNGALRRHLKAGNFWLVMITQDAEGMKRKLLSGEPTPISYPSPKPDSILQEDREIASFPIPVKAENIHIVKVQEVFE